MPRLQSVTIPLSGEAPIQCPQCSSDAGLHFDEVSLIDPGGNVVPLHAEAEGDTGLSVVTATIANGALPGQRHLIVLPHWCSDCGNRGEVVLRQQSGQTTSEYREVTGP